MLRRITDSTVTTKAALRFAASRYKIDDDVAGVTRYDPRTFRDGYKRATRHARRAMNANLRRGLLCE